MSSNILSSASEWSNKKGTVDPASKNRIIMTTGRLITLACCAAILVLGVEAAPRIPTEPLKESENEVRVDLRSDEVLSSGFLTDMERPRCGFVDDVEPNTGSRTKRWAPFGDVWTKKHLTYSIFKYSAKLPDRDEVYRRITEAFATWAKYVDLNFTRASGGEADIVITFESGQYDDCCKFDGPGGVLAHAFSPGTGQGGDIHFNDDIDWDLEKLYKVTVHEIGHSLGLDHSNSTESTMYPSYLPNGYGKLSADDIAGIQALYGVKANSSTEEQSTLHPQDM